MILPIENDHFFGGYPRAMLNDRRKDEWPTKTVAFFGAVFPVGVFVGSSDSFGIYDLHRTPQELQECF